MGMKFNSPLSLQKADQIIDSLALSPGDKVIDVGCGSGGFLIRVVARSEATGLGIDNYASSIESARKTVKERITEDRCEFREADINAAEIDDGSFALAMCIGSTHAYGSGDAAYPNAIRELSRIVRPGGLVLIGEGYWKRELDPEYLKFLGDPTGIYRDHAGNVAFAEERGLVALNALTSSVDEWDEFEWGHQQRIEQKFAASPDDPQVIEQLKWRREWMKFYLRWGRDTMGFGFYLFRKPAS